MEGKAEIRILNAGGQKWGHRWRVTLHLIAAQIGCLRDFIFESSILFILVYNVFLKLQPL